MGGQGRGLRDVRRDGGSVMATGVAAPSSPLMSSGMALSSLGSLCTVLTSTVGAPLWVGIAGVVAAGLGVVMVGAHIRRQRRSGQTVLPERHRSTGSGHSPRCRAKSASTCRCPGRRRQR
jgi:hypothetical protein